MSRVLRELVGKGGARLGLRIAQLEAESGRQSIDVRLAAEVLQLAAEAPALFAMDPGDTTISELSQAAIQAFWEDEKWLANRWQKSGLDRRQFLTGLVERWAPLIEVPVIKHSVLRRLLTAVPAKKTMKAMGYRSYESFVKRVDIEAAMIIAQRAEGLTWHRSFYKKLSACKAADIDMVKPHFVKLQVSWVGKYPLTNAQVVAAVGVVDLDGQVSSNLAWLSRLSDALFHLQRRAVYAKLRRFSHDFAATLAKSCYTAPQLKIRRSSHEWSTVYAAISRLAASETSELLQSADVAWRQNLQWLPSLHQRFAKWPKLLMCGKVSGRQKLSLNISDIAENLANALPLGSYQTEYLAREINTELECRYLLVKDRAELISIIHGQENLE